MNSKVNSKMELDNLSAVLCGRMLSLDRKTRLEAANEASAALSELPTFLRNSPHCQGEIEAMNALIVRVRSQAVST